MPGSGTWVPEVVLVEPEVDELLLLDEEDELLLDVELLVDDDPVEVVTLPELDPELDDDELLEPELLPDVEDEPLDPPLEP